MAETKDEIETHNKAVVQASFDAWKAGTGTPYDLLADDASWTIVGRIDRRSHARSSPVLDRCHCLPQAGASV